MPIPRDFVQDSSGDWDISSHKLRRTSADDIQQFTRQKVSEVLNVFRGEWFLNLRIGIPYFRDVWGQRFDERLLQSLFRRALLRAWGVSDVVALVLDFNSRERKLGVRGVVRTVKGTEVPFTELILED